MVLKHEVDYYCIPHMEIMYPRCNGSFSQKGKLKAYLVKCGTKERPHKCDINGGKDDYRKYEDFKNHKNQVHKNTGFYNCTKCGKQLKSHTGWRLHMAQHAKLEAQAQNPQSSSGAPPAKRRRKDKQDNQ